MPIRRTCLLQGVQEGLASLPDFLHFLAAAPCFLLYAGDGPFHKNLKGLVPRRVC